MTSPSPSMTDLEALLAHLDGELDSDGARALSQRLAADPALAARVEGAGAEFAAMRALVRAELEAEAASVHPARFEQIWDAVAADARAFRADAARSEKGTAIERAPRGWRWMRQMGWPLGLAAAGAAALAVVVVTRGPGEPEPGGTLVAEGEAPATAEATAPATAPASGREATPSPERTELAALPPEGPLPAPDSNEADVERIEFGGASGRISKIEGVRGTTTVIWIEEDEAPTDSERSL